MAPISTRVTNKCTGQWHFTLTNSVWRNLWERKEKFWRLVKQNRERERGCEIINCKCKHKSIETAPRQIRHPAARRPGTWAPGIFWPSALCLCCGHMRCVMMDLSCCTAPVDPSVGTSQILSIFALFIFDKTVKTNQIRKMPKCQGEKQTSELAPTSGRVKDIRQTTGLNGECWVGERGGNTGNLSSG